MYRLRSKGSNSKAAAVVGEKGPGSSTWPTFGGLLSLSFFSAFLLWFQPLFRQFRYFGLVQLGINARRPVREVARRLTPWRRGRSMQTQTMVMTEQREFLHSKYSPRKARTASHRLRLQPEAVRFLYLKKRLVARQARGFYTTPTLLRHG